MFTVGLMADPRPVVNHVHQIFHDLVTNMSLTGKHDRNLEDKLERMGKNFTNINELFEALYKESAVELPGTALHNQHVNFYSGRDVSPIYLPSKQFMFFSASSNAVFTMPDPRERHFHCGVPDSFILCNDTDDLFAKNLLNTVRRISQIQPIGHLVISAMKCEDIEDTDVFNMSKKSQSIHVVNCVLPDLTLDHLLQQIKTSMTLTIINLHGTSLQGIKSLSIQYLPSLTHLCLSNTNLCRFHILHLGYLIENKKLPQLGLLILGENNFNHLQDDLNVFLQIVAKQHQRDITVEINECCLPASFFQRIGEYTKLSRFLRILGEKQRPEGKS